MEFKPVIVDLSHHDDVQNWDAVKAFGILGVINKATEGMGVVDHTYAIRQKPARDRGILYGAYHFMRPGDPVAQADHFLEVTRTAPHPEELLLALDHEDPHVSLDNAKKWLQRQEKKRGKGKALGILAAKLGRAVYHVLAKKVAFEEARFWAS